LKYSLRGKEIASVLSCANQFKTKNISFKYIKSNAFGVGFSVSRGVGSAVLRNSFKRRVRTTLVNSDLKSLSLHILVRPQGSLPNKRLNEELGLFKQHIIHQVNKL
tara:strand:- start:2820 stop:3137 length:318 start_codon:yes stop_codon:yes gene_type:complete